MKAPMLEPRVLAALALAPMTALDLARALNITRARMNRELACLRASGAVTRSDGRAGPRGGRRHFIYMQT